MTTADVVDAKIQQPNDDHTVTHKDTYVEYR